MSYILLRISWPPEMLAICAWLGQSHTNQVYNDKKPRLSVIILSILTILINWDLSDINLINSKRSLQKKNKELNIKNITHKDLQRTVMPSGTHRSRQLGHAEDCFRPSCFCVSILLALFGPNPPLTLLYLE